METWHFIAFSALRKAQLHEKLVIPHPVRPLNIESVFPARYPLQLCLRAFL